MIRFDFPEFNRESLPGEIESLSFDEAEALASGVSSLGHNGPDLYGVGYHRNSDVGMRDLEYWRARSAVSKGNRREKEK